MVGPSIFAAMQKTKTEALQRHRFAQSELLYQNQRLSPGTVSYTVQRFQRPDGFVADDLGLLTYTLQENSGDSHIELSYCITGNMYCRYNANECKECKLHQALACEERIETVDYISFYFPHQQLQQITGSAAQRTLSEDLLAFKYESSFSRSIPVCNRTRLILETIVTEKYQDSLQNIFISAQSQMLLLYMLEAMDAKPEAAISSIKELDREKLMKAKEILLAHLGDPITIKQLSRKVAMNECYLKKGFKELFGTTIFEFYQNQRMEYAKDLLYDKGLNVTEVSSLLGYSSISHFSTAFKRHTGIKPCELLWRAS